MQAMAEGRRGRWMTTTGREENIAAAMNNSEKVRWLYYLLVCLSFCLQAMAKGQRRGGWWRRRRHERTTCASPKKVRWLYYPSVVCFFWLLSLWSPTCWLWQRDNDGGWWWRSRQRDERTTLPMKVRWLYYLSVVLGGFKSLCCLPHAG